VDGSPSNPLTSGFSNLTQRLLTALVALPLLLAALWVGGPWYILLVSAAALAATWEYQRIAAASGGDPCGPLLYVGVASFLIDALSGRSFTPLILTGTLLLGLAWSVARYQQGEASPGWLWTLGGVIYIGWLMGHFLLLRDVDHGRAWTLLALMTTFLNDTASYIVGRAVGRHRMAPNLSPGKTWEGAAGGLTATAVGVPLFAALLGLPVTWSFWGLGLVLSVAAQTGDLAESMLKRVAGMKDASGLVPGHGGILDRLDSLVFVVPLLYYYVIWLASTL